MEKPPVILLAYANDRGDDRRYLRNLPAETRRLRSALKKSVDAGHCELIERTNATLAEILAIFRDSQHRGRIAIFHYAGHADSYHLLFETPEGEPAPMRADAFARFLGVDAGRTLQLIFLNGCSTRRQAQALLDAGVAAVLATERAIDDAAATEFADNFFAALANGHGIKSAFDLAQAAVQAGGAALWRSVQLVSATSPEDVRPPWELHIRAGADSVGTWNLPDAVGDHLFGLPALPERRLPPSPFRHLQWFGEEQAELFFGRGKEIRELYNRVTSAHAAPLLLLYGQSGVGKSSLLAAGLLPRLAGRYSVCYTRRNPEGDLTGTVAQALGVKAADELVGAWHKREEESGLPLLLIVDQVEEAYTRQEGGGNQELTVLLDSLLPLFASKDNQPEGKLIFGFRKEWLPDIRKQLEARRLDSGEFFLDSLERAGVMDAVRGPTMHPRLQEKYQLSVAPDVPQRIADDLLADAGAAVAPTLQILLAEMWKAVETKKPKNRVFTADLYSSRKRAGILLGDFLDQQLRHLQAEQAEAVDSGLALDMLHYHTTPFGTAQTRPQDALQRAYPQLATAGLLRALQAAYLLAEPGDDQEGEPSTRLAHDTLAPLVQERFARSTAPGQQARRILENRVVDWRDGEVGAPLDEKDLARVEEGLAGMRALDGDEERLLEASRKLARIRRRNRFLVASAFGFLVVVLLLIWQFDGLRNIYLRRQAAQMTATVSVAGLQVDTYEVQVGHYNLCVEAGRCEAVPLNSQDETSARDDAPITNVSAFHAAAYCGWLGKRLPTSLEWSAIATEVYPVVSSGRDRYDPAQMNLGSENSKPVTALPEVGGDQPVGLIGNVWDWTSTVVSPEAPDPESQDNAQWNGQARDVALILRGGSFVTPSQYFELDQLWNQAVSVQLAADFGFRCVDDE